MYTLSRNLLLFHGKSKCFTSLICAICLTYLYLWHVVLCLRYQQVIIFFNCRGSDCEPVVGKVTVMWPAGHGFEPWKQALAEILSKAAYNRSLWSDISSDPAYSKSLVHRAAFFCGSDCEPVVILKHQFFKSIIN